MGPAIVILNQTFFGNAWRSCINLGSALPGAACVCVTFVAADTSEVSGDVAPSRWSTKLTHLRRLAGPMG